MLAEIENGIVDLLKSAGFNVRDVDLFDTGDNSSADKKSRSEAAQRSKLPAVYVGIEMGGFESLDEGFTHRWRPRILIAVAFKGWKNDRERRQGAVDIMENVVETVSGQCLGLDIGPITPERFYNITDTDLADKGVHVYQIEFSTWFDMERTSDTSALDNLRSVVATWDMDTESDGEPTPVDTIELEGGS